VYLPNPPWLRWIPDWLTIRFTNWPYLSSDGLGFWECLKVFFQNFVTAFYFSVVTFVTLGYGDITPASTFGKVMAISEVTLGYSVLGLLVAVASARLRPR
jgi:hypothetical protein